MTLGWMGKVNMGLFFILCFAVVTTCHCLDVKMPKMIESSLVFSLPVPCRTLRRLLPFQGM